MEPSLTSEPAENLYVLDRLDTARREAKEIKYYDYIVVNDTVEHAAQEVLAILTAQDCRTQRRIDQIEGV